MAHLEERELLDLAQGPLPAGRRDEVEEHLRQCAECRRRFDDLQETSRLLGEWEVGVGGRDLWPAIEARVLREGRRVIPWPVAKAALRIAATVLLAFGMGHVAGRWARHEWPRPESVAVSAAQVDDGAVSEWLHLSTFAQSLPTGLAAIVLDDAPGSAEETL